jgi:hypothetical protein
MRIAAASDQQQRARARVKWVQQQQQQQQKQLSVSTALGAWPRLPIPTSRWRHRPELRTCVCACTTLARARAGFRETRENEARHHGAVPYRTRTKSTSRRGAAAYGAPCPAGGSVDGKELGGRAWRATRADRPRLGLLRADQLQVWAV